ncbi:MAG: hypothetical protein RIT28_4182 [Pseudomonadota bacterium]
MRWTAPILTFALFACKTQDDVPTETGIDSEINDFVDLDADGFVSDEDCDDDNAAVNPAATETCDGVDQDCDGEIDEGAADATAWPVDEDGDGYASATGAVIACEPPEGTPELLGDCDDDDDGVYPGAPEDCGDGDLNCDGEPSDLDTDGDGAIDCEDCGPDDALISPDATETCDGVDQDCDGEIDEDATDASTFYTDSDGDGFGDADAPLAACALTEGLSEDDTDCNDADAAVNPDTACDYVVQIRAPGTTALTLISAEDTTVSLSGLSPVSLTAGNPAAMMVIAAGDYVLRADAPFLTNMVTTSSGGDQLLSARDLDGAYLSDTLYTWAGEHVWVVNPSASDIDVTLDLWDGSAWALVTADVVAAGASLSFSDLADGVYRVTASAPVLGWGAALDNPENHLEQLVGTNGGFFDSQVLWSLPELIGKPGLTGLCVESSGCSYSVSAGGSTLDAGALDLGEGFSMYVSANTLYTIDLTGAVLVRDESSPSGYTSGDGTCMDADLAPGRSGDHYDTEFVLQAATGTATSYPVRRTDLTAAVYADGTTLTVESWSGGAWSAVMTASGDAGDMVSLGDDYSAAAVLRVTSSAPIHLQMTHTTSEFAWAAFSDHYAD